MISEAIYTKIQGGRIKILITKQMFQRLAIVLAQVKASNASENLKNEIRQIRYLGIEQRKLIKNDITI